MTDNFVSDHGSAGSNGGVLFASDDIGGVHYPINKLGFGVLDSVTLVSSSNGLPVNVIAGSAGSTQYAEDAAHVSGDTGTMALGVRQSTPTDLSAGNTNGDYEPFQLSASGRLWVSANIDQINAVTPLMGAGNGGTGSLRVNIASDQLVIPVSDNAGSLTIDNGGTFAVQESGSALTSLQLIDDIVHSGDAALSKYAVLGGVFDDVATVAVTENQAQSLRMSSRRILYAEGHIASAAADTGNPLKVGGKYNSTLVALADGNRGDLQLDVSGQVRVAAGGITTIISANFTRPADTTAYAAGDQVSNSTSAPTVITFTSVGRISGGSGVIVSAVLVDESNPSTKGSFELWLFDTTRTPNNDNVAFAPTVGQCETVVAVIPFTVSYAASTGALIYLPDKTNLPFLCAGSANLFGNLVVRNAYTPANAGKFFIRLNILQD